MIALGKRVRDLIKVGTSKFTEGSFCPNFPLDMPRSFLKLQRNS